MILVDIGRLAAIEGGGIHKASKAKTMTFYFVYPLINISVPDTEMLVAEAYSLRYKRLKN